MMSEWITAILLISGACFMLLASIGLIRLPDVYMRMQASTKAPTLGLLLMLIGLCIHFTSFSTIAKAVVTVFFIFLTIPIASLMIAKAAHLMKIPKWKKTQFDDLEQSRKTTEPSADPKV